MRCCTTPFLGWLDIGNRHAVPGTRTVHSGWLELFAGSFAHTVMNFGWRKVTIVDSLIGLWNHAYQVAVQAKSIRTFTGQK